MTALPSILGPRECDRPRGARTCFAAAPTRREGAAGLATLRWSWFLGQSEGGFKVYSD